MKTYNFKLLLSFFAIVGFTIVGCQDLSVDNVNEPTKEAVEGNADNQSKLLGGGYYDFTTSIISQWGLNIQMYADQNTTTNNVNNWWDFTDQPRIRLNNSTSYASTAAISTFFSGSNSAVATANLFINRIVNDGETITNDSGADVTDAILAQAYFLRGLSYGYLGMIYDQAYLIDENFVVGEDVAEFVDYGQLIDASISDLDAAISLAAGAGTFTFNTMPNPVDTWNADEFQDIANTYAAKIMAGEARTASEAAGLDWDAILAYAEKGLGGPDALSDLGVFANQNIGSSGEFAHYMLDWENFIVEGDFTTGAGYNPTDVKQIHLLDPDYPTDYPAENAEGGTASYPPAESDDPRIGYFKYTQNAGFLNNTRNPLLYSNYFSARFFAESDWWPQENKVIFLTDTENDLLLAEAQFMTDNPGGAATTLNNSAAGEGETTLGFTFPAERLTYVNEQEETVPYIEDASLSGGHTMTGAESEAQFQWALLREYSVEIHALGGVGTQWFFMRRHDMLQPGTPTMFPVPGGELEILGLPGYTFGGEGHEGEVGTATGDNDWRNLADEAFPIMKQSDSQKQYSPIITAPGAKARSLPAPKGGHQ